MLRRASYQKPLVSEIAIINNKGNVIIAPGQGKTPISLLHDSTCEKLAFPYIFPERKLGYSVLWGIPVSTVWYLNKRLLNFHQTFASDSVSIFFARFVFGQDHQHSSENHGINAGQLTVGTIKQNYRGTVDRFVAIDNVLSFMSSVKWTQAYLK